MQLPFYHDVRAAGGEVFLVGGAVRDKLMGQGIKDIDLLVRGVPAAKLQQILARHGRVETTGRSFAVFKFITAPGEAIDVALPRVERSTGVRHGDFDVQADPELPVEADLGRRDFTINAIAQEVTGPDLDLGALVDPFGGAKDIEAGNLRCVFDRAFEEDALRVLRGVQFAARFDLEVEARTLSLMTNAAPLLPTISPERVIQEIGKLLGAPRPSVGFRLMARCRALATLFPELDAMRGVDQPPEFHIADVFEHTMMVVDNAARGENLRKPGDIETLLAALYHDVGKPPTKGTHPETGRITFFGHENISADVTRERLIHWHAGMIGAEVDHVVTLVQHHLFAWGDEVTDKGVRRFIRKVGADLVDKIIDLCIADLRSGAMPERVDGVLAFRERVDAELTKKPALSVRDLAIGGRDLIELGYKPGPAMGEELARLFELVTDDPALNEREKLLSLVHKPV